MLLRIRVDSTPPPFFFFFFFFLSHLLCLNMTTLLGGWGDEGREEHGINPMLENACVTFAKCKESCGKKKYISFQYPPSSLLLRPFPTNKIFFSPFGGTYYYFKVRLLKCMQDCNCYYFIIFQSRTRMLTGSR